MVVELFGRLGERLLYSVLSALPHRSLLLLYNNAVDA